MLISIQQAAANKRSFQKNPQQTAVGMNSFQMQPQQTAAGINSFQMQPQQTAVGTNSFQMYPQQTAAGMNSFQMYPQQTASGQLLNSKFLINSCNVKARRSPLKMPKSMPDFLNDVYVFESNEVLDNRKFKKEHSFKDFNNWENITAKFGTNKKILVPVADQLAALANIKIKRDDKRLKMKLAKWFNDNWEEIKPHLDKISILPDDDDKGSDSNIQPQNQLEQNLQQKPMSQMLPQTHSQQAPTDQILPQIQYQQIPLSQMLPQTHFQQVPTDQMQNSSFLKMQFIGQQQIPQQPNLQCSVANCNDPDSDQGCKNFDLFDSPSFEQNDQSSDSQPNDYQYIHSDDDDYDWRFPFN